MGRSHRGWYKYLDRKADEEDLTLEESVALAAHNTQNWLSFIAADVRAHRLAAEHLEGMIGAIDVAFAEFAARAGISYPASSQVREALDQYRDTQRKLAELQRQADKEAQGNEV